jgi:hypothetical protein
MARPYAWKGRGCPTMKELGKHLPSRKNQKRGLQALNSVMKYAFPAGEKNDYRTLLSATVSVKCGLGEEQVTEMLKVWLANRKQLQQQQHLIRTVMREKLHELRREEK